MINNFLKVTHVAVFHGTICSLKKEELGVVKEMIREKGIMAES